MEVWKLVQPQADTSLSELSGHHRLASIIVLYNFMAMTEHNWLVVFSPETWREFSDHGASVAGFNDSTWNYVSRIAPDDRLVCYVTESKKLTGVLKVKSKPYRSQAWIWTSALYPCRVHVEPLVLLSVEEGLTLDHLIDRFVNPTSWKGYVRRSPSHIPKTDAELIGETLAKRIQI